MYRSSEPGKSERVEACFGREGIKPNARNKTGPGMNVVFNLHCSKKDVSWGLYLGYCPDVESNVPVIILI